MAFQRNVLVCGALLSVFLLDSRGIDAQTRFQALNRDEVAAVPGLEVITIRDGVLNVCFTLFVVPPVLVDRAVPAVDPNLSLAARERDQRLAALSTEYETSLSGGVPAVLASNPFKFQWLGDIVQSEYEHTVRQSEIDRLVGQLAGVQSAPGLAVAGPAPCGAPASSSAR